MKDNITDSVNALIAAGVEPTEAARLAAQIIVLSVEKASRNIILDLIRAGVATVPYRKPEPELTSYTVVQGGRN